MNTIAKNLPIDNNVKTISFNGSELITVKLNEIIYTAIRPIVEAMGLNWGSQSAKLKKNKEKFNCCDIATVGQDGKNRTMLCIPIRKLNGWLFSINPEKVRADIRETVIKYQEECFEVLYNYWHNGIAVNSRPTTKDERTPLKNAVNMLVGKSNLTYSEIYKMVHQYMGVTSITDIPLDDLPKAVEYIHSLILKVEPQVIDESRLLHNEFLKTAKNEIIDYVRDLEHTIKQLSGEYPKYPDFNESEICQAFVVSMLRSHKMMFTIDYNSRPNITFVPNDHWIITDENIANIIGDPSGISKSRLPDIMNAVMKRAGM